MIIALAGNPNSGKTTLFNALTGSNQSVGNWPGVTVEKKEGMLKGQKEVLIQDLPGIYSLSPYSPEERVTRGYLVEEKPDAIINIVDASNLERNLYLTCQLAELGLPMVVALNMMDIVRNRQDKIDVEELEKRLGVPVVELSAARGEGISKLTQTAVKQALRKEGAAAPRFDKALEGAIAQVESILKDKNITRWQAVKVLEADEQIVDQLSLDESQLSQISEIRQKLEGQEDDDAESLVTDARYDWIGQKLDHVYWKNTEHKLTVSDKIDRVVTNRYLALPIFIGVMAIVYFLSLNLIGTPATDFVNDVVVGEWLQGGMSAFLTSIHASEWVISLVVDGILGGIGAPLGFLPQMAMMFLCLSFLEGCGYMSRIAFIMDRIFRRFGLSGKSFISFMISSGCAIPGILSTRTIEEERDRKMTMIVTSSMPCGAKLPIISLIAGAVLGGTDAWWIGWATYLFGIAAIIVSALLLKRMKMFAGPSAPFIMELPAYHWPRVSVLLSSVGQRCWSFLKKAGSILFVVSGIIWFLMSFGFGPEGFGLVDVESSFLAVIGNVLAPVFAPLGWGNWQAVAASLSGFVAKEQIVSTMGVLVNVADDTGQVPELWQAISVMLPSGLAAMSFLVFNLLDAPCLAAVSTLFKEMNSKKWSWFAIGWQMFYAYTVSLMIYQIGMWITAGAFGFWTAAALVLLLWYLINLFIPQRKHDSQSNPILKKASS